MPTILAYLGTPKYAKVTPGTADCYVDHVPRSPVPPYRRVADALRARIDAGELLPGEQVPSMAQLVDSYGISRGTARRVLATLKDEGYVYITPGWGTFVVETPPGQETGRP